MGGWKRTEKPESVDTFENDLLNSENLASLLKGRSDGEA